VSAPDRPGLLHAVAAAFFAAGVRVVAMTAATDADAVVDRFEVTDASGAKLGTTAEEAVRRHLAAGVTARRRRFGRTLSVR
jgi:UTP:GlnB (protein PII) uridylyltransferase